MPYTSAVRSQGREIFYEMRLGALAAMVINSIDNDARDSGSQI
jgi:hypothetical protein